LEFDAGAALQFGPRIAAQPVWPGPWLSAARKKVTAHVTHLVNESPSGIAADAAEKKKDGYAK
jgi:hypothetical protein